VSPEQQAAALDLFRQGNAFFVDGQYPKALEEYRRAIVSWDHPAIRFNLAVCLVNLDQPVEAYENLEKALAYGEAPIGPDLHAQGLTYRKLLLGRLAHVTVRGDQVGTRVTLDGRELLSGPGEQTRLLLAGEHELVASNPGHLTETRHLVLIPGDPELVLVHLRRIDDATTYTRRWQASTPWWVAGAGAAVALLGGLLRLQAVSDMDQHDRDILEHCPTGCDPEDPILAKTYDLRDRSYLENGFGIGGLVVGTGLVATGVIMLVLNQPRAVIHETPGGGGGVPPAVTLAPALLPGGAGVTLTWTR
jgi:tetratricopeptide (TPR) repeat protein